MIRVKVAGPTQVRCLTYDEVIHMEGGEEALHKYGPTFGLGRRSY
jgi:hypothetical protein